jgi:hypothetical protein
MAKEDNLDALRDAVAYQVMEKLSEVIASEREFLFKVFGVAVSIVALAFGAAAFIGVSKLQDIEQTAKATAQQALDTYIADSAPREYERRSKSLYLHALAASLSVGGRFARDLDAKELTELVDEYVTSEDDEDFRLDVLKLLPQFSYTPGWPEAVRRLLPFLEIHEIEQDPDHATNLMNMLGNANDPLALRQAIAFAKTGGLRDSSDPLAIATFRYLVGLNSPIAREDLAAIAASGGDFADGLQLKLQPDLAIIKPIIQSIDRSSPPQRLLILTFSALLRRLPDDSLVADLMSKLFELDIPVWFWEDESSPVGSELGSRPARGLWVGRTYWLSPNGLGFDVGALQSRYRMTVEVLLKRAVLSRNARQIAKILLLTRPDESVRRVGTVYALDYVDVCGVSLKTEPPTKPATPDTCGSFRLATRGEASGESVIQARSGSERWSDLTEFDVDSPDRVRVFANFYPKYLDALPLPSASDANGQP